MTTRIAVIHQGTSGHKENLAVFAANSKGEKIAPDAPTILEEGDGADFFVYGNGTAGQSLIIEAIKPEEEPGGEEEKKAQDVPATEVATTPAEVAA
jgi:hypothetical protein